MMKLFTEMASTLIETVKKVLSASKQRLNLDESDLESLF
jgi:hypothetical protein